MTKRTEGEMPSRNATTGLSASDPLLTSDRAELLSGLLSNAVEPIFTIDGSGQILTASRAALQLLGYSNEQLVGASMQILMPPEHMNRLAEFVSMVGKSGPRDVASKAREVEAMHRDGTRIPFDLSVVDGSKDGRRVLFVCMRDARERRFIQDELQRERDFAERVIDTAPTLVRVLDLQGRLMRANQRFAEATGWPAKEHVGKPWAETFCPLEERETFASFLDRLMSGQELTNTRTATLLSRDGRNRRIQWHSTLLRDRDEPVGVLSIGLDVTDTQRTEEMLLRSQKMEAVGRLTGGIAHDFNNLLMGVLGCCRMALERLDDQHAARPMIEEIQQSAQRSVQLTRRLLTFSRREPFARAVVDVLDIVRAVCGIARQVIGEDIALSTRFSCAQALVEGDPTQLEQVLMNLIVNARDAMPNGGSLTLRVREEMAPQKLADAGHVVIEVEDSGCGMSQEVQQRIFDPFFTTKPAGQGTGLGLATVFGIVSRMGGDITVHSSPGLGSCFRITLPRTKKARDIASHDAAKSSLPHGTGETVLLVEDESIVRLTLENALRELGYKPVVAGDAQQALAAVQRGTRFDVLLTDVVLPGVGGPELAASIRRSMPSARVVFMSAHSHEHLVQRGRLRPGDLSLEKPFTPEDLAAKLREALSGKATAAS